MMKIDDICKIYDSYFLTNPYNEKVVVAYPLAKI